MSQAVSYLSWLCSARHEFEALVKEKLGAEAAEAIDWRNPRMVCIAAILVVLVALAGLAAYLIRDGRTSSKAPAPQTSSASPSSPTASASASPPPHGSHSALPVPPSTHDPITFGKAAAAALWSYDTRAYSQHELLAALHK